MTTAEPGHGILFPDELLAFAGLARLLVRADGQFTKEEADALEGAATELYGTRRIGEGPYRGNVADGADAPTTEEPGIFDLLEKAGTVFPDDEAIRQAARGVVRPEARDMIFGVLYEVAASDVIAKTEWPILDWLRKEWGIEIQEAPAG